jgi:hypothetical protein
MPLSDFQNKLESLVTIGEAVEKGKLGDNVRVVVKDANQTKERKTTSYEARIKQLGEKLRALFGKYNK